MNRLLRRRAPRPGAVGVPAWRGPVAQGAAVAVLAFTPFMPSPRILNPSSPGTPVWTGSSSHTVHTVAGGFHQIILPDLAVIAPAGLSAGRLAWMRKIPGVRNVLGLDGAAIGIRGHEVNVFGVDPQQYRSWTPLATASDQGLWTALAHGEFVASGSARRLLRLHTGRHYRLRGAAQVSLGYAGAANLGVAGIDVVVSNQDSARLGLIHNVAALISAPGVRMSALKSEVAAAAGHGVRLVGLRPRHQPGGSGSSSGRPTSYLQLFQKSAARYCPGLSWTVLAAIGQIESGDGANNGPSSAGALGPMQFMPSTWRIWGITAFGQPRPPNIMDPYDAVPSAARYLCAAGAALPGGLPGAIYAYNHADWYVQEVLALAAQYARVYG